MSILVALSALSLAMAMVFARLWRCEMSRGAALGKDLAALHGEAAMLARELEVSKADYHKLAESIKSASSLSQAEREEYEDKLRGMEKEIRKKTEDICSLRERNKHLRSGNRNLRNSAGQDFACARSYVHERLEAERNSFY